MYVQAVALFSVCQEKRGSLMRGGMEGGGAGGGGGGVGESVLK